MSGKRNSFFTNAIIVLFLCIAFLIAAEINLYVTIITPIFPYILLSCVVGPSILLAFFRKLSPWAVIIGMISGILICVAWHYFRIEGYRPYGIPMVHEIIPGFFIPLLLICLIDRLAPSSQKT